MRYIWVLRLTKIKRVFNRVQSILLMAGELFPFIQLRILPVTHIFDTKL
jgi:hypothetical protein